MSIFISYRRDGGKTIAESIYQALSKSYDIFLDTESLKNGVFDEAIVNRIEQCTDFLVIITETVFNRCSEPNDWIFHEAQIALREHKNIIPIFVGIKAFPSNVPEPLKEICRYNGIFWDASKMIFEKMESFLLSNHRSILSFEYKNDRLRLCSESQEELKAIYHRFLKNGRLPVDIQIQLLDKKHIAEQLIRTDIVNAYGEEFAIKTAYQSLINKFKMVHKSIEAAIEYMILDELLEDTTLSIRDKYIEMYGIMNCFFTDEDGVENFYWLLFLWYDIIEEIAKELIEDRYYTYENSKEFTCIDCYTQKRNGDIIFSFVTHIPNQAAEELFTRMGLYGDYWDLSHQCRTSYVYPNFYYNIGKLKTNNTIWSYEELSKYKGIFNLTNYYFGKH